MTTSSHQRSRGTSIKTAPGPTRDEKVNITTTRGSGCCCLQLPFWWLKPTAQLLNSHTLLFGALVGAIQSLLLAMMQPAFQYQLHASRRYTRRVVKSQISTLYWQESLFGWLSSWNKPYLQYRRVNMTSSLSQPIRLLMWCFRVLWHITNVVRLKYFYNARNVN